MQIDPRTEVNPPKSGEEVEPPYDRAVKLALDVRPLGLGEKIRLIPDISEATEA